MPVILSIFVSMYIHVDLDFAAASDEATSCGASGVLDLLADD